MYDAIIVGGGPAGLSAALILGRCLRTVLVCDAGRPRNAFSHELHAYLTRDGTPPSEFLNQAREELKKYETVKLMHGEVSKAEHLQDHFEVTLMDGAVYKSKKLLLATGVVDKIPDIEGFSEFYGTSVFNCPYCDAWEMRNKKIVVYGKSQRGFKLSRSLRNWSEDVLLCTDGPCDLSREEVESLKKNKIILNENKIKKLAGEQGQLQKIVFENGEEIERDAMFFNTESLIRSRLLNHLDCEFSEEEGVEAGKYEQTKIPGLFVAGNILREVQLVIVAAAEGAQAAFGINTALTQEQLIP